MSDYLVQRAAPGFTVSQLITSRKLELKKAEEMDYEDGPMDTAHVTGAPPPSTRTPRRQEQGGDQEDQSGTESDLTDLEELESELNAFYKRQAATSAGASSSRTTPPPPPPTANPAPSANARRRQRQQAMEARFADYTRILRRVEAINAALPPGATPVPAPPAPAKYNEKHSAFGRKRKKLSRTVETVAAAIRGGSLGHSKQGYLGASSSAQPSKSPQPQAVPTAGERGVDPRDARHEELRAQGYVDVKASNRPFLFTEEAGKAASFRLGCPNERLWDMKVKGVENAVLELDKALKRSKKAKARKTEADRGNFTSARYGFSFGGGQGVPKPCKQEDDERKAWKKFMSNSYVQEMSDFIADAFETWAPDLYELYNSVKGTIAAMNPVLDVVAGRHSNPFAAITVNFGPRTVCLPHRDIKNLAYGLCAILVLGSFDYRRGGHIVLHKMKLIVEMRPGDIIFIPSAVVTHENIPIGENEWRKSVVYYTAGGLFRWAAAGYKTHVKWRAENMEAYKQHQAEGERRWEEGWNLFSPPPPRVELKPPAVVS